jgi:hypothetical protein
MGIKAQGATLHLLERRCDLGGLIVVIPPIADIDRTSLTEWGFWLRRIDKSLDCGLGLFLHVVVSGVFASAGVVAAVVIGVISNINLASR